LIARFESGLQVVYKPRSLAVDVHFQELLAWLNQRGSHLPFRTLRVLDRGTHGWVEFVEAYGCASVDEVRRFYERQGGYLALLYALEATDMHYENLIAAGEHPVLLDLEALFHPHVGGFDPRSAEDVAGATMVYSVLGVGLLPQRMWSNVVGDGIDLSGLGTAPGQLTPHGVPQWEGLGTDEMRLIRKRVAHPGADNRPSLNGSDVNVLAYTESIAAGFSNIYQLLLKHRAELLAPDGPLARFAQDEVRIILRNTRTYGMLLFESFHPDMLRDGLDRDRLFDRLWGAVEQRPYLARIIPAERDDLLRGDIPIFTTRPGSRDLWTSSHTVIAGFSDGPGLYLARRRIQRLSDADLARQLWFVRAALTALSMDGAHAPGPLVGLSDPRTNASRDQLLAAARAIGDRLAAIAVHGEDDVAWIGLMVTNEGRWTLVPLDLNLYDGMSGIVLFLAYLGAITGEQEYTALAQAALTTVRRQIEARQALITSIGGFAGWGGIIYMLTHLAALWDQPALVADAEAIVAQLPDLIDNDTQLDIVGGAAGCIASLIGLYQVVPSERTLDAAIRCGDRLLSRAQPMEHGIAWALEHTGPTPLTGFSHGAAGMAWALLDLAALTDKERFRTAALQAIAYERALFVAERGNWPDLRELSTPNQPDSSDQPRCMTAWCHGAPGIGLARLRMLRHHDDDATRAEIDAALQTTVRHGFGGNHSLCHGDLGNLETLLLAAQTLDDPKWTGHVNRIASSILESIERAGWLCANPLAVESPELMTGLAGIGYELLRLAEPGRVPSVLALAAPVA
jgi:type 2 lantibiotic biosynthesis protein LanM